MLMTLQKGRLYIYSFIKIIQPYKSQHIYIYIMHSDEPHINI